MAPLIATWSRVSDSLATPVQEVPVWFTLLALLIFVGLFFALVGIICRLLERRR